MRQLILGIIIMLVAAVSSAAEVTLPYVNAAGHSTTLVLSETTGHSATISVDDFYAPFPAQTLGGGSVQRGPVFISSFGTFRFKGWPEREIGSATIRVPTGVVASVEIDDGSSVLSLPSLTRIERSVQFFGLKVGNDYRASLATIGDCVFAFYRGDTRIGDWKAVSGFTISDAPLGADRVIINTVLLPSVTNPLAFVYHRRQSGRYELTLPVTNFMEIH